MDSEANMGDSSYIPLADMRSVNLGTPRLDLRRKGGLTLVSGVLALLAGISIGFGISSFRCRPRYDILPPPETWTEHVVSTPTYLPDTENPDLEALRDMVAHTQGFWARDYSLHLGWNNLRYILEAALLHGSLLNRTVIIPSFFYARSCEYDIATCAMFAPMVNRGDALGLDEWRNLPLNEQMSWRIPISVMLNMTLLRSAQPVITVSEYLRLHNISEDVEESNGHWEKHKYHLKPNIFDNTGRAPTLHVIENAWYDPRDINRIDVIPEDMKKRGGWSTEGGNPLRGERGNWTDKSKTSIYTALEAALPDWPRVVAWDQARQILQSAGHASDVQTDEGMEKILNENGWEVLYTYEGALGMDYIKNVVRPIRQVAPRQTLRGLREDYADITADVLLLTGELHYERKPGSLRFTTVTNRDFFSRLVLYHVRATQKVNELGTTLAARMGARTKGRMWVGAHMRRGDFVRVNWAMEKSLEDHLSRILTHVASGRNVLRSLRGNELGTYDIPDVTPNRSITRLQPPLDTDSFYLATDERDPVNIAYLAQHGAVLVTDLLTMEDRRTFGWPLMLTDILGQVEQVMLARAHYFYGHAMSSYVGGIINMRAERGLDPRTAFID